MKRNDFVVLQQWANAGSRTVSLEYNNQITIGDNEPVWKIWVYDYKLKSGKFVDSVDDLPTKEDLLAMAKAELTEKLKKLLEE